MPELPDVTVYVESLEQGARGATLRSVRVHDPFLLRTVLPKIALALFEFDSGTLVLTEAGSRRHASLHVLHDRAARRPGAVAPVQGDLAAPHRRARVIRRPCVTPGIQGQSTTRNSMRRSSASR